MIGMTKLEMIQMAKSMIDELKREGLSDDGLLEISHYTVLFNEDSIYVPSDDLKKRLKDYNDWKDRRRPDENVGNLLEEIALLTFMSLKVNFSFIKSFTSFDHQLDLVLGSEDPEWRRLLHYVGLPSEKNFFIIECKNYDEAIGSNHFSRLSYLMTQRFASRAKLGIFFARNGATGFPKPGSTSSLRKLSDSQATQIILNASEDINIIVIDDTDIAELDKPGSLIKMIKSKILAIVFWDGKKFVPEQDKWTEVSLPVHLSQYMTNPSDSTL